MSYYFVLRTLLDLAVTFVLVNLLAKSARRFKKQRVRHAYLMYLPTLVSLVLILQVYYFVAPKLVDMVRLASDQPSFAQVTVETAGELPGMLHDTNGERYHYNPFVMKVQPGERYSIRYLPSSGYIIKVDTAETGVTVPDEGETSK